MDFKSCFAVLCAACSGTPAGAVQSKPPTVATADPALKPPSIEACKTPQRHDLMVIDWTPEKRGDLEAAMKQGIVVVSYDCTSLKVIPCAPEGSYGFIGTTRREKTIELKNADEVAANLPVGGLTWLSDVGGKIDRQRGVLAQMVSVGKRTASPMRVAQAPGCEGGTHYVLGATIGAFAVATGSSADLAAAATVLGKGAKGSSQSSTKIAAKDGELEACAKSTSDAKTPPEQCGAIVRVELEPLGAPPAAVPELAVASCAPGFAVSDGKCVKLDQPHQCKPDDAADCKKQCDAGDAGSCATLAVMHRDGKGAAKDLSLAGELGKRACDKDNSTGCRVMAAAKLTQDRSTAVGLLTKTCEAGDGAGCVDLGVAQLADKATAGNAQYSFRRACYGGGNADGCAWLGALYAEGKGGMRANLKLAVPFYEKGCKDGSGRACDALGELTAKGNGVAKDAVKAKALFAQACALRFEAACSKAGK